MGRFLTRDTWEGDANNPITFNYWVYASENPINLTDPSGKSVSIFDVNGYAEGRTFSMTIIAMIWLIRGQEIVYNFETMERAHFTYTGKKDLNGGLPNPTGFCVSVLNFSGAAYISAIFGFDQDGIERDYSGPFIVGQVGVDIPIPVTAGIVSVGGGGTGYSSVVSGTNTPNLDVFGVSGYLDISAGAGVWDFWVVLAGYVTDYTMTYRESYGDNFSKMAQDIKSGKGSPINGLSFLGLSKAREKAAQQLMYYRWLRIYDPTLPE